MEPAKDTGNAGYSQQELSVILSKINRTEWLPSPNQVLTKCLKLLTEDNTSIKKMGKTFKIEGSLCSQLLKVANSAFYSHTNKIDDIDHAMMIIGLREVKNICLAAAIMHQFGHLDMADSFDLLGFWRHSMLTSFIADELAADKAWIKRDAAQLYGLLHDLGRLVMGGCLAGYFEKVFWFSQTENKSFREVESDLGITHTYLGWALAKKWRLPEPIQFIVRWHHAPLDGAPYSKEAALIHVSDYLTNIIMEPYGISSLMPPTDDILSLAGIGRGKLENYMEKAQDIIKKTDAIIQTFK